MTFGKFFEKTYPLMGFVCGIMAGKTGDSSFFAYVCIAVSLVLLFPLIRGADAMLKGDFRKIRESGVFDAVCGYFRSGIAWCFLCILASLLTLSSSWNIWQFLMRGLMVGCVFASYRALCLGIRARML